MSVDRLQPADVQLGGDAAVHDQNPVVDDGAHWQPREHLGQQREQRRGVHLQRRRARSDAGTGPVRRLARTEEGLRGERRLAGGV